MTTGKTWPPPEYYTWFAEQTFQDVDKNKLKELVTEELTRFKSMSTEEYILWQKWEEVQHTYPMSSDNLLNEPAYVNQNDSRIITQVKTLLWNEQDYENLEPELLWIGDKNYGTIKEHWTALRILIHSQQHSGSIGRGLNYLVRDRRTRKYLGVVSIASDFLDLTPRDQYIGWTREQRTQEQRIQHTAVCSTIVPVQPFGFNYVGGKLLALLCLSDQVQNQWQSVYGSKLVGLTTTSLYGKNKGMSQYDNLKFWKKMGYSTGSAALRLTIKTKEMAYAWAKNVMPQDYYQFVVYKEADGTNVRDRLNRLHQKIYRALGINQKLFTSNHDRGIYFAPLYTNTNDFLCNKITEDKLVPISQFTIDELTSLWKEKYASRRIKNLVEPKKDRLFYDDLSLLSWEEARIKYLGDIGR